MGRFVVIALVVPLVLAACANDEADPDRITRIVGPATVEDDG